MKLYELGLLKTKTRMVAYRPWIGVDLDGTPAHYDGWKAWNIIGPPIPLMMARVPAWLTEGHEVRIFTARVGFDDLLCHTYEV